MDNLFAATELTAKARLLMEPDDRLLGARSDGFIASKANLHSHLGNVDRDFVALLNELAAECVVLAASRLLVRSVSIVHRLVLWQHSIVKDAADEDGCVASTEEENMAPSFCSPKTGPNLVAGAAGAWTLHETIALGFEDPCVLARLLHAPLLNRVLDDVLQVREGTLGEVEACHFAYRSGRPCFARTCANGSPSKVPLASPSSIAAWSFWSFWS